MTAPRGTAPRPASHSSTYRLAAVLSVLCLAIYWQAFRTWFYMDDFAWLGLPLDLRSQGLWKVLFTPAAQGTVRVFSERAFFLIFTSAFGLHALPFKILVFLTQFANLTLLGIITRRLTCSATAAYVAAVAFLFNSALATPMAWTSAYNEILWTFTILLSFYFLLRHIETGQSRYNVYQWITFLLGFGVLELNVVYPALAALYALCCARRYFRATLLLFIPAILFTVVHFSWVPKTTNPVYRMYFDADIPRTFARYVAWALGPSRLGGLVGPAYGPSGYAATALIAVGLAVFAFRRRSPLVVFLLGWFVIVIAPVLPLKNHITDYYVTVAIIGPCILAGCAFSAAVHSRGAGALAVLLLAAYCTGHYAQYRTVADWRYRNSTRFRDMLRGVEAAWRKNPRDLVMLSGVDWDLFAFGFNDEPFRLFGMKRVALAPGSETQLLTGDPLRGIEHYTISSADAVHAFDTNSALVLAVGSGRVSDITEAYKTIVRSQYSSSLQSSLDVGVPSSSSALGAGWFPPENGFRWTGPSATLSMAQPATPHAKLEVSGYSPAAVLAAGPLHLTISANGRKLGTVTLTQPDHSFTEQFSLPASSGARLEITATIDRPTVIPGDGRRLGIIFGKFAIKEN